MKTIRFGIIGGGLMGREFAAATARWATLIDPVAKPSKLLLFASGRASSFNWFTSNFPLIKQTTTDWRELLKNDAIDAYFYIAKCLHDLHAGDAHVAVIVGGQTSVWRKAVWD